MLWFMCSKDNAEVTEGRSSDDAANVTVVAKGGVEEPVDDALSQDLFQPKPGRLRFSLFFCVSC